MIANCQKLAQYPYQFHFLVLADIHLSALVVRDQSSAQSHVKLLMRAFVDRNQDVICLSFAKIIDNLCRDSRQNICQRKWKNECSDFATIKMIL